MELSTRARHEGDESRRGRARAVRRAASRSRQRATRRRARCDANVAVERAQPRRRPQLSEHFEHSRRRARPPSHGGRLPRALRARRAACAAPRAARAPRRARAGIPSVPSVPMALRARRGRRARARPRSRSCSRTWARGARARRRALLRVPRGRDVLGGRGRASAPPRSCSRIGLLRRRAHSFRARQGTALELPSPTPGAPAAARPAATRPTATTRRARSSARARRGRVRRQIARAAWDDEFGCEVCEYFDPFGSGRRAISSKRETPRLLRTRSMLVVGERVVIVAEDGRRRRRGWSSRGGKRGASGLSATRFDSGIAIVFGEANAKHKGSASHARPTRRTRPRARRASSSRFARARGRKRLGLAQRREQGPRVATARARARGPSREAVQEGGLRRCLRRRRAGQARAARARAPVATRAPASSTGQRRRGRAPARPTLRARPARRRSRARAHRRPMSAEVGAGCRRSSSSSPSGGREGQSEVRWRGPDALGRDDRGRQPRTGRSPSCLPTVTRTRGSCRHMRLDTKTATGLVAGVKVKARIGGRGQRFHPATIKAVQSDGALAVVMDDTAGRSGARGRAIRRPARDGDG